jgi:hypothetical protein
LRFPVEPALTLAQSSPLSPFPGDDLSIRVGEDESQQQGIIMRIIIVAAIAACGAFSAAARADEPAFSASRPGQTEGPIAVPAGYFQVETEIASMTRDEAAGVRTDGASVAATTFRYGLADGLDAELIVAPYLSQTSKSAGVKDTIDGVGDVTVRVRRTLAGENGDGAALAVIGFVTLPTARDGLGADDVEGGAIVTGSAALSKTWGAAWTIGVAARSQGGGDYQAEFSGAVQLNHAFTDKFGAYIETAAVRAEHDAQTAATVDLGATYQVATTTQLDAGVLLGVTDAATDSTVFVGWAHRF